MSRRLGLPPPTTVWLNESMTTGAGGAGASAQREYDRRKANDEAKTRAKWGRLGGIAVALSDERQSTAAWASGAIGEREVGLALDKIASNSVRVLHDRRIPGSKANIDHLVVTPHGIWVVDAKRYKNRRPSLRVDGGIIRPRVERLMVGGRDQTKLVEGVLGQIERIRTAAPGVDVRGVLCFVDADWPMFGGDFRVRGVDVCRRKKLVSRLLAETSTEIDVEKTTRLLESVFRAA